MTEQEFLKKVGLDGLSIRDEQGHLIYIPKNKKKSTETVKEYGLNELYITKKWISGGVRGGSCWGGKHRPRESENEPEFQSFDGILEKICPNISYLQYKKLLNEVKIEEKNWDEYEYYGNSTNYTEKTINLKNLYDVMVRLNLLCE